MPYIEHKQRVEILELIDADGIEQTMSREDLGVLVSQACECAGDFQYIFAVAFQSYLERKGLRYQQLNDIMGALAGAQQEFYREIVAPYEELKIEDNGPVYDLDRLSSDGY